MSDVWYLYVVRCSDSSLYTGITKDVKKRVTTHNKSKGAKYTRSRLPVVLVSHTLVGDKGTALRYEYRFKSLTKKEKEFVVDENSLDNFVKQHSV